MSDDKLVMADGDFADRAARHDRNRDPQARRDKQERLASIGSTTTDGLVSMRRYQVAVSRVVNGTGYVAHTLDHPPLVGPLSARGRNLQHALTELRFAYAYQLKKRHFVSSMQDARSYALGAEWVPVDLTDARIQVAVK